MTRDELTHGLGRVLQGWADVRLALLFGSSVTRGLEHAHDVDVAVAFTQPVALLDQCRLAEKLEDVAGREVDLVDLDSASTLLRAEVARDGVLLWAREPRDAVVFRARASLEYFDLQPYREREAEGLRRILEAARWSTSTS